MKITLEQQRKGQDFLKEIIEKAWSNDAFKKSLIENPRDTIKKITGTTLNENSKIVVEDQMDSNIVYLNIPRKMDLSNFELTDEQLEIIAGGGDNVNDFGVAVGIISANNVLIGVALVGAAWDWMTE